MTEILLAKIRDHKKMSVLDQVKLVFLLSVPAIMAQISNIIMSYIDASMVGKLGAKASASIGLVSSSTWLIFGLTSMAVTGFTVQTAQAIGAKDRHKSRNLMIEGILIAELFALFILCIALSLAGFIPVWLGGNPDIIKDASWYLIGIIVFLPFNQLNMICSGMLQATGNMKLPSLLNSLMCLLDMVFNAFFIFERVPVLNIPGMNLGVLGAALGTGFAQLCISLCQLYFLARQESLAGFIKMKNFSFQKNDISRGIKIGIPAGLEQFITCFAYVMFTKIVAPLGSIAIAANSFSITAESLCYEPGYGVAQASTTIIGQCIGASNKKTAVSLSKVTTLLAVGVMGISGIIMYFFSGSMISFLSSDAAIIALAVQVLKIEAFAEPMYGASIVVTGILRGAGDTLIPTVINFLSIWCIRLPLAWFLSSRYGLSGIWFAMAFELNVRGILFLVRLKRWQTKLRAS